MDDYNDTRGEPPMDYDTAEAAAIKEALPMLEFIQIAHTKFGQEIGASVIAAFDAPLWKIASEHDDYMAGGGQFTNELYQAMLNHPVKDPTL